MKTNVKLFLIILSATAFFSLALVIGIPEILQEEIVQTDIEKTTTLTSNCEFYNDEFSHLEGIIKTMICDPKYTDEYFESREIKKQVEYQINSHGFRGDEFEYDKPNNTFRIFLVGGSTIQGWGVDENETISHIMQNEINNLGFNYNFEVINAGFGGAWSKSELNLVKDKIIKYDPDLLIIYDGWNDALTQNGIHLENNSDATAENWKNRWDKFCKLHEQDDFDIIITLQPILFSGDTKIVTDYEYALEVANGKKYHNSILQTLDEYTDISYSFTSCKNINDLTSIFDGVPLPIFIDTGHVGNNGNEIVATKFIEIALPIITEKIKEIPNKPLIDKKDYNIVKKTTSIQNDLTGKYLENNDYSGMEINEYVFKASHILIPKFTDSNINNSNFRFSVITNSDFVNSQIENSNFPRSILLKSDLENAIISNSNLSGIRLNDVNLSNSQIHDSTMLGAQIYDSIIHNSNLKNLDISLSWLENIHLSNTEFHSINLEQSIFTQTTFENVLFNDIKFNNAEISGNIFRDSHFVNVDFSNVEFSPKFSYDSLIRSSHFINSTFTNSNFNSALFTWSDEDRGVNTPNDDEIKYFKSISPKFYNCDLANSDLSKLNLNFVSFNDSNLINSNLSHSSLQFTDLSGANLEGANLEGANLEGANLNCSNHAICINN